MLKVKGNPYPYQREAIDFHKSKQISLNIFDMGLGKSLIALHSLEGIKGKIIIVCPAYLRPNWQNEIGKWTSGGDFTVTSYESLHKCKDTYDAFILDEAHFIKNRTTNRTKFIFNKIKESNPSKVILLTGTPVKNNASDFWTLLYLCLGNDLGYDYLKFAKKFAMEKVMKFNGRRVSSFYGINKENSEELSSIVRKCAIRKKVSEVLDLPEKNYIDVYIEDATKFTQDLKLAFEEYLNSKNISSNFASLKAVNAKIKAETSIALAQDIISQGKQVVVFTDHVETCKAIAFKLGVPAIHGGVDRQKIVDNFTKGITTALVATISSLNTGVNLVNCSYMIVNDFNYTYSEMVQAEARIYRIGQQNKCFYYYVYASDIDKRVHNLIQVKKEAHEEIKY